MTSIAGTTAVVLAALAGVASVSTAQSIASQVARVSNGTVRMTFAAKPGICGSGNSIRHGNGRGRTTWGDDNTSRDVEWESDCSLGPARVVLDRRGGELTDLRFYVGGRWRPATAGTVDLGTVSAREAADYLVSIAQSEKGSMGEKAIFPATIADPDTVGILAWASGGGRSDRESEFAGARQQRGSRGARAGCIRAVPASAR